MNELKQIILKVEPRDENVDLNQLRKNGWIPAVLYGRGYKNINLQIKSTDFIKVFSEAGESTLINIEGEGIEKSKVLIKEVQIDPVKDNFIHVDLYKIRMDELIYTEIPLRFVGEAPAVKDLGGILVKNLDKVEVKCLPGDLIHDIEVDISQLKEFNDSISIKDLKVPESIELLSGDDVQIVSIAEPRKVEEDTPVVEESASESAEGDKEDVSSAGEEGSESSEKN